MVNLYEWPTNAIVASVLVLLGVGCAERGTSHLLEGLRQARSLEVVRGIRGCVLAAALAVCVLGVLTAHTGFLVLGAVFLSEGVVRNRCPGRHHPGRRAPGVER
jgi:hypothetical protein